MKNHSLWLAILLLAMLLAKPAIAQDSQSYEVLPPLPTVRGQIWVNDGPVEVLSENHSLENRFRLGIDYQFGRELRFQLGLTIIDEFSSGESSSSVGSISREGTGFNLGYFLVPDKWYILYTLLLESVSGSRVTDEVTSYGHQFSLGYRFYSNDTVHVDAQFSYLHVPSVTVPVYDVPSQSYQSATYPSANIWGLGVAVGAYFF